MNNQFQLCFYSGSLTGKIFPIVKDETKIGRDASCDIILSENSVSRVHVILYSQQNGAVILVDNNSTNGTVVNNIQISAPVQLSENDVICLGGEVMLVFQKAAGFEPGVQLGGMDVPAGNAPESYNFENQQGIPMNNDNNNFPNDGAVSGSAGNGGQSQQPAENFGFNQAYNMGYNPAAQQGQQMPPFGYGQQPQFGGQFPQAGYPGQQMPPAMPMDNVPAGQPQDPQGVSAEPAQDIPGGAQDISQQPMMGQQMPFGNDPYAQQPMMGQQNPYGNPYGQQPMGQQMPYGNDPYSQQQMMGQQNPYGNPYGQQPMGQQMPFGNDPYSQQQPMGQQMPFGNDPYSQQQPRGQQMPYGNDPYGQQQMMGQQMPYGNDPYGQQQMGQQNPYGNPYGQQQMPYGNNPYAQQQMPYGNNPYGQQPYPGDPGQNPGDQGDRKGNSHKKLFIILAIVLAVLILIAAYIIYVDVNRLWCDAFPVKFLWDADTCANYPR